MAETGASTVDFEKLVNDTDSRIASLEKQPSDIEAQMDTLKQKYEEAEKIKDDKERKIRLEIIDAEFKALRDKQRKEEEDLANAVFGLNAILEEMGAEYANLQKLNSSEQKLIDDAKAELGRAHTALDKADEKWFAFRRNAAKKEAQAKIEAAKELIKTSEQEAHRQARQRLLQHNMEQSLQDFMYKVSKTIEIMDKRVKEINTQLESVQVRKDEAFNVKAEAAAELEKLDAELNTKEAALRDEEELLETMTNGTEEHAAQSKKISALRTEVEAIRGSRNKAFVLFESKEKFAKELEIHERTQMKLRDNQLMWITSLRSDTEERVVTFRSRLEAMKAMSDQDVAKQLDDMGAAIDQSNAEYMAAAGAASDKARMEKIEKHPERIAKMDEVQAAQAEAVQKIRVREKEAIQWFKENYGIDPTRSSFFSYEES
jgi:hypothetical protein